MKRSVWRVTLPVNMVDYMNRGDIALKNVLIIDILLLYLKKYLHSRIHTISHVYRMCGPPNKPLARIAHDCETG